MYPICPILIMILYICRHTQSHMPLFMPRIERAGLCVHRVARDSAVAQAVRSLVGWPGPGLERISGGPQLWGSHGIPGTGWCWMLLIGTWISMIHWQVALSHVGLDSLQRLGSAALFGWSRPQLIAILKGKTMMTHRIWGFLDAIFN